MARTGGFPSRGPRLEQDGVARIRAARLGLQSPAKCFRRLPAAAPITSSVPLRPTESSVLDGPHWCHMDQASRRGQQDHDLSLWEAYQERRRRGTRRPLDWRYSFRLYLGLIPATLLLGLSTGLRLLSNDDAWQDLLGLVLIASTIATAAAMVRWLQLPVDPDAQARLLAEHEENRLE